MAVGMGAGAAILSIFLLAPITGPMANHYNQKTTDSEIVKQQKTSENKPMSNKTANQVLAIKKIFDADATKGSEFEKTFIADNAKRIEQYKDSIRFSEKQRSIVSQIYEKYKE